MFDCELKDDGECGGSIDPPHHLISKKKLQNNPEGKRLIEEVYPHILMAILCRDHHTHAHNRKTTRLLLLRRVDVFGLDYVRDVVNEVAATFEYPHEFTWDALVG